MDYELSISRSSDMAPSSDMGPENFTSSGELVGFESSDTASESGKESEHRLLNFQGS